MKKGIYSYPDSPTSGEVMKGKSECVPNQALNIRDIMMRSLRGSILPEVQMNNLEYGQDEDFEDAFGQEVDLTDIEETQEKLSYFQQRVKQVEQARQAKPKQSISQTAEGEELPPPKEEKVD